MIFFKIPFQAKIPYQKLETKLGGNKVEMTLSVNSLSQTLTLRLSSVADSNSIISDIPLLLGQNLLEPYPWWRERGGLFVISRTVPHQEATPENFGVTTHLLWQDHSADL